MYAELEKRVLGSSQIAGIALRYGFFYGPRTWYWTDGAVAEYWTDGAVAEQVKRQEAPIISNGKGVWSFVHVEDAAAATVAALNAEPGIYNVVDDDPERVARWLPAFARWIGGPEPAQIGAEEASKQAGPEGVYLHTQRSGASNRKAKVALAFNPRPLIWTVRDRF